MKALGNFKSNSVRVLLTDIDGTLTQSGQLPEHSYSAMCQLSKHGILVIPVTGRPAGWCEMIARLWPVHGVIGENGSFYFRYEKKMKRVFARSKEQREEDRKFLKLIEDEVLDKIKGADIASDQFCRLFDLAIDFKEDVTPLKPEQVQEIVKIFKKHGAQAKVSNIHVNGWFGNHNKVSTCQQYLQRELNYTELQMKELCAFIGDSPNDEPMFQFFPHSFAVANIKEYIPQMKSLPSYVTEKEESLGFVQLAERLLALQAR